MQLSVTDRPVGGSYQFRVHRPCSHWTFLRKRQEKCSWKHSHLWGYLRWTRGIYWLVFSGRFVFRIIIIFIFGGRLPVFMLTITFFARGRRTERNVCFSCLTWLYGLFVGTLISVTNAYAGCGRPTLNFIERSWLGSVRAVLLCSQ